jgi:hypothetical protein
MNTCRYAHSVAMLSSRHLSMTVENCAFVTVEK